MELRPVGEIVDVAVSVNKSLVLSEFWKAALDRATPDQVPALVQRLDRQDEFYYIVTMRTEPLVSARLAMDAQTPRLLEAEGIEKSGDALPEYVDPIAVLRQIAARRGDDAAATLRIDMVGRHPVLVWKPCRESTSRLVPFWLFTIRDRLLYIRVDGATFTHLTTTGRG